MKINANIIKEGVTNVGKFIGENYPALLTGFGIGGFGTAVIFGIRATPRAIELIDQKAYEIEPCEEQRSVSENLSILTPREIVAATWKCYIPTVGMIILSSACIIGAYRISHGRNLALAGAYTLAEKTLDKYQEKIAEIVGEDQNREILKSAEQEAQKESDLSMGLWYRDYLCYDELSGQEFRSNENRILAAVNEFNQRLISDFYLDVNEWYLYLGAREVGLGEFAGWNCDRLLDISVTGGYKTETGEPCLRIVYNTMPRVDYRR